MQSDLQFILTYTAIPALALVAGGSFAIFRVPSQRARSIVQHFAAGVVFSAVAAELLPEITRGKDPIPLLLGFVCGVGTMLVANWAIARVEPEGDRTQEQPRVAGLLIGVAIDLFVDGLLVGISFVAGPKTGVLITLALTLELLFLGLAVSATLRSAGKTICYTLTVLVAFALIVLGSAALGDTLLAGLAGARLVSVLSFATAALLYLVTEELLAEAHKIPDTTVTTTMFFVGFLGLLVIEMSTR